METNVPQTCVVCREPLIDGESAWLWTDSDNEHQGVAHSRCALAGDMPIDVTLRAEDFEVVKRSWWRDYWHGWAMDLDEWSRRQMSWWELLRGKRRREPAGRSWLVRRWATVPPMDHGDGLAWTVHRRTTEPPPIDTGDYISLPGVPVDYTSDAPPFHVGVVATNGRGYIDGHLVEVEWGYVDPDGVWTECERGVMTERRDGTHSAAIRFV